METHTSRVLNASIIGASLALFGFAQTAQGQHYFLPRFLESPSAVTDDAFGLGLAVNSQYVAVGSWQDDVSAYHDGRVYLFNANTGSYVRTIYPTLRQRNGAFGSSVAIEGNLLLTGAWVDNTTHGASGGAYLHNINTGALIAHFVTQQGFSGQHIGFSVAMQAPVALIGAPNDDEGGTASGGVFVFHTDFLFEITKIKPTVPIINERFGTSVAVDGNYIVIGAPGNGDAQTGAVYVFNLTTGAQLRRIVPAGSANFDRVGASVAINNGIIAIGAPEHDSAGPNAGAVYLYNAATGALIRKITRADANAQDRFGSSVSIEDNTLVVGSPQRDQTGSNTGSVFVYDNVIPGGEINEVFSFSVPPGQEFGRRVAINDGRIVGSGSGFGAVEGYAAILYQYCDVDVNADGLVNFFDVSTFINNSIDWNGDGTFNFFDVSGFINAFTAGCP